MAHFGERTLRCPKLLQPSGFPASELSSANLSFDGVDVKKVSFGSSTELRPRPSLVCSSPGTDIKRSPQHVRSVPILLQKSKIEQRQKSRKATIDDPARFARSKCGDAMLRSYLFEAAGVLLTRVRVSVTASGILVVGIACALIAHWVH
jgi:hypothetical protein